MSAIYSGTELVYSTRAIFNTVFLDLSILTSLIPIHQELVLLIGGGERMTMEKFLRNAPRRICNKTLDLEQLCNFYILVPSNPTPALT